jgi:hypothetical protein
MLYAGGNAGGISLDPSQNSGPRTDHGPVASVAHVDVGDLVPMS